MGWCEGTTFCCQGALNAGDCDCSTGDGIVDPGQGKPNTVIQEGFQPPSSPTYLPAKKESSTQTPTSTSAAPTPKPSSGGGGSGGEDKGGDGNGQGGSTGLSTAAKAGIGVGATVAAILAVAAGVYFCKGGSDGRNVAPHFTD
jgi:hypothetical protein